MNGQSGNSSYGCAAVPPNTAASNPARCSSLFFCIKIIKSVFETDGITSLDDPARCAGLWCLCCLWPWISSSLVESCDSSATFVALLPRPPACFLLQDETELKVDVVEAGSDSPSNAHCNATSNLSFNLVANSYSAYTTGALNDDQIHNTNVL